jgi:hypothetical protein
MQNIKEKGAQISLSACLSRMLTGSVSEIEFLVLPELNGGRE